MRWSIVNYLRVLYKASRATEEEVQAFEAAKESFVDRSPSGVVNDWR
jgi:hypothetical protein